MLLETYTAMVAMIFLKGTQICYIAVPVAMGNGVVYVLHSFAEKETKVPLGHQAVCLRMCLCPPG
jgi:hypothetical protein